MRDAQKRSKHSMWEGDRDSGTESWPQIRTRAGEKHPHLWAVLSETGNHTVFPFTPPTGTEDLLLIRYCVRNSQHIFCVYYHCSFMHILLFPLYR